MASTESLQQLSRCLTALEAQCARFGAQMIVARAGSPADVASLRPLFSAVQFVWATPGSSAAELRRAAMAEASGDIVAFTDDSTPVDDRWLETAIGGPFGRSPDAERAPRGDATRPSGPGESA